MKRIEKQAEKLMKELSQNLQLLRAHPIGNYTINELLLIDFIKKVEFTTPKEIQEELNFPIADYKETMRSLLEKGLVQKERSDIYRNVIVIQLTKKSKRSTKEHYDFILPHFIQTINKFGEEETKELIRLLNKFNKAQKLNLGNTIAKKLKPFQPRE